MLTVWKVLDICHSYIIIFRGNEILQYFTSVKESDMKKHKNFFFFNDASGQVFKLCASTAAAAAKLLQLCLTLCDAIDGSPLTGMLQLVAFPCS